jgi:tetratricopeptide (TPR) repeat protein
MLGKGSGLSRRLRAPAGGATEERPARALPLVAAVSPGAPEGEDNSGAPRLDDPRYPRPRWLWVLRTIALRLPVLLLAYPLIFAANLLLAMAHSGFSALRLPATYVGAALLPQAAALFAAYPLAAGIPILLLVDLLVLRRLARRDEQQEEAVLQERLIDLRLTQTRIAAVAFPSGRGVPRRTRPTGAPREERMPGEAAPGNPQGPPGDLALLPEPPVFVGRAVELAWLVERLRGRGSLAALTDATHAGGVGCTSLLARAARLVRAEGRFADGVAVLDCAGQRDSAETLRAALARFDPARRQPEVFDTAGLLEAAQTLLVGKDVLVVLENVETGLALSQITRPLLVAGATVALTSREPRSDVPAAATLALGPLPLDEALALFTLVYAAASTGLLVEPKPATAERVVNALARLPLALTLVATYAADEQRVLSSLADVLQVDARGGLGLATDDAAGALALALETALGRLAEPPRRLFAAFGVFAADEVGREAVLATAEGLGVARVGEHLRRLVRRGLVMEYADERLRLHPAVRALAAQQLAALSEGEQGDARFALAAYYAGYLIHASDATLERDEASVIAALEWAHRNAQAAQEAAICDRMRHFWRDRGNVQTGLRYLPWGVAAAAARARATGELADRQRAADLALSSGELLRTAGKLAEAEQVFQQNLAIRQELGDQHGAGLALVALGELALEREQVSEAGVLFQQALGALQAAGARRDVAICQAWLGRVALLQGRLEAAASSYAEALALDQEQGDRHGAALDLASLGQIALRQAHLEEAERFYEQALELRRALGDRHGEGMDLYELGQVAHQRGTFGEAERYFAASLEIRRDVRDRQGEAITLAQLGRVAARQDALDQAEGYYRQGLDLLLELQDAANYAAVALRAGQFFVERRDKREDGCTLLHQAIELYTQMELPDELRRAQELAQRLGCA